MDQEQNTQTPAPDVEPPTIGSLDNTSSISPVVGASANDYATTPTIVQPAVKTIDPPKKSGKVRTVFITVAVIILIAGAGLAVFYFAYRTPDSEYDVLLRNLRSMREDVKMIPKASEKVDDDYNMAGDKARVDAAKAYVQKLEKIKNSKVVKHDTAVRAAYDSDKEVIEAYGQASIDAFETVAIHKKLTTACQSIGDELGDVTTVSAYNSKVLNCEKTMDENPHVPLKSFDESRHTKTIAAYKEIIEAYRKAYVAYEAKDTAKLALLEADIMKGYSNFREATSGGETITNTKNPTYILDDMIKTAEQRKSVFFRS